MKEESTHKAICDYIRYKYPDAIFMSDGSGLKLPMGLAIKYSKLKSGKGIPDLFIAYPNNGYFGLFLEIKKEGAKVFKRDGSLRKDEHLEEQAKMLDRLKMLGYASYFVIGFDMSCKVINDYMSNLT